MAGRPKRRARLAAERATGFGAGVREPGLPQTLGIEAAEAVKDRVAAETLLRHEGNVYSAIAEMGVDPSLPMQTRRRIAIQTFASKQVLRIINDRFADLESQKKAMLSRMVRLVRFGDPDTAIKAFQSLSRVAGWNAPTKIDMTAKSVNIHSLVQHPELLDEALGYFSHEPGAATAIRSEDVPDERKALKGDTIEGEVADAGG